MKKTGYLFWPKTESVYILLYMHSVLKTIWKKSGYDQILCTGNLDMVFGIRPSMTIKEQSTDNLPSSPFVFFLAVFPFEALGISREDASEWSWDDSSARHRSLLLANSIQFQHFFKWAMIKTLESLNKPVEHQKGNQRLTLRMWMF